MLAVKSIAAGMALVSITAFAADVSRKPKALVIMLDGMRGDAVENACAPNLQMLRDGRWQPGYKCAWTLNAHTLYDAPALSAPNHVGIACGVTSKKSTIVNNGTSRCDFAKWPSWLVRAVSAKPELKALFMFSWNWDKQLSPDPRVEFVCGTDESNAANMAKRLSTPDAPDAVMWYIDWTDHGGHLCGYYPYTPGYLHCVHLSDKAIGGALAAIASRPTFDKEDWFVIVTADHGGYGRSHGALGGQSETIPFLMTGRDMPQGKMNGIPHNYDVAPTVLAHFGIDASGFELTEKQSFPPFRPPGRAASATGSRSIFRSKARRLPRWQMPRQAMSRRLLAETSRRRKEAGSSAAACTWRRRRTARAACALREARISSSRMAR